jgi:hypothetical protein
MKVTCRQTSGEWVEEVTTVLPPVEQLLLLAHKGSEQRK